MSEEIKPIIHHADLEVRLKALLSGWHVEAIYSNDSKLIAIGAWDDKHYEKGILKWYERQLCDQSDCAEYIAGDLKATQEKQSKITP